MVRPVVIEAGTGILAVGVLSYPPVSPFVAILSGLGGMFVVFYGFAPRGDEA